MKKKRLSIKGRIIALGVFIGVTGILHNLGLVFIARYTGEPLVFFNSLTIGMMICFFIERHFKRTEGVPPDKIEADWGVTADIIKEVIVTLFVVGVMTAIMY